MENINKEKSDLMKLGLVLMVVLVVYFGAKIVTEIKGYRFIGGGATASNTISFDGKGEVSASPDIAMINFTIKEDGKEVKEAQDKVTKKEKSALDFLEKSGVEKKDIKTESYNSYPQYEYTSCAMQYSYPCRVDKKVIGYEVSQYFSVKVRDLSKAGEILKGIGLVGVSDMSGPNFAIEKEDALKAEARKLAIEEAKNKAESLSRDLGVKLVRIVSFSENGNYSMPMYAKAVYSTGRAEDASIAPELPSGENKITSNVTITYEIR